MRGTLWGILIFISTIFQSNHQEINQDSPHTTHSQNLRKSDPIWYIHFGAVNGEIFLSP